MTNISFSKQAPTLLVLLAAGCLTSMTGGIVAPVFPEIVEQLRIDPGWAGTLVSVHTLMTALSSPVLGILADRIGKLRVLIFSLVCYGLFGTAGGLMQSFDSLLWTRALLGVSNGGIAAASIGLLGGMYEGESRSRVMGYATSALATASIIFPLLGGWVGSVHWRFAFCLYVLALPVALAASLILRKRKFQQAKTLDLTNTQNLTTSLLKPSVLMLFLGLGLASAMFYVVIVYAPLYFKVAIGANTVLNGAILASRAIGAAIVSAVGASLLAKKLGVTRAIGVGFGLMALTLIAIPHLEHVQLALFTALLFGMGFGIVMPNLYSILSDLSPVNQRSGILAIGTGVSSLGQFLSPVFLGPVWKSSGAVVFYVAGVVGLVITFLSFLSKKNMNSDRS
ncbi:MULTISPECIES: MFS transporter [Nostocales]|uniref:MFS transporter n=3 Tax=Nostocales TaxID=1161 RepID=A0A0C1NEV0_9CYAN|nr:MFS transporter [Tolypothrix bouteillei]KAF3887660.1 MFS transporter [Tolypothrix bouteillei VB521301]